MAYEFRNEQRMRYWSFFYGDLVKGLEVKQTSKNKLFFFPNESVYTDGREGWINRSAFVNELIAGL